MLDIKVLGERIKSIRKEKGLTQGELAEALSVSFQAVSNWERGIAPPDLENLMHLSEYFGVLMDDLLKEPRELLYLGIDGGGTKTEFTLVNGEGAVLCQLTRQGCNPNDISYGKMLAILVDGIREIRLLYPSLSAVFCGISGVASGNYRERALMDLKAEFPTLAFEVESDAMCLFGIDERVDIAMISGTGSVVFIKDGDEMHRIGGWGYLFDTAGSAYDMGRDAIICTLAEEDERRAGSLLRRMLLETLGVSAIRDAVGDLYREGKVRIASLSTVVIEAYKQGDETAIQIVQNTAKRLAALLQIATEKYSARPYAVACGGVIENNAEWMIPLIQKYTNVYIYLPNVPPVYGACRCAVKITGCEGEQFYENFKKTYRGV